MELINDVNNLERKWVNIIEDDPVITMNLTRYFDSLEDINVGISAGSVEQYLEKRRDISQRSPDVLLLDIGLPGISGLEGIPHIKKLDDEVDIIMLTTFEEESKILKAMALGAVAYLSKKTSLKEIADAIRVVHQGGSYMSPMVARDIFNYIKKANRNPTEEILTSRQYAVLKLIVDGKTYLQIAEELFISAETVKSHTKNIYKALHVKNKAEAISKYLKTFR
jgi:DNA-binding NarL/FixJ family response regulator